MLRDGDQHQRDADRRADVHDRRDPRHLGPRGASRARARAGTSAAPGGAARPDRLRGGADRERDHRPRRTRSSASTTRSARCSATRAEEFSGTDFLEFTHPEDRASRRRRRSPRWSAARSGRSTSRRATSTRSGRVIEARVALTRDPRRRGRGRAAVRPDRGRHRRAPDQPGARAGAVRDARAAGGGRRVPRRRHRPAHAPRRRPVGRASPERPGAARRASSSCSGSPRRCTTSARSRSPTRCCASPAS